MKKPREYKQLCSKCGLRHVKLIGLKCQRHTTCSITMSAPVMNVTESQTASSLCGTVHGIMATTMVTNTTTTTTSVSCSALTMTSTATASSARACTMNTSSNVADPNVGDVGGSYLVHIRPHGHHGISHDRTSSCTSSEAPPPTGPSPTSAPSSQSSPQ